jgi:hypothetical protein
MVGIPYAKELTGGAITSMGGVVDVGLGVVSSLTGGVGAGVGAVGSGVGSGAVCAGAYGAGVSEAVLLSMADTSSALLLVPVLVPLAMGQIVMNSVPVSLVADLTQGHERAQALSLLRASGDLGYMCGATCSGLLATCTSIDTALQLNGALAAAGMSYFAYKNLPILYAHRAKD